MSRDSSPTKPNTPSTSDQFRKVNEKNALPSTPVATTGSKANSIGHSQVKKRRRRTRSHSNSPSPGRGFYIPGFVEEGASGFKKMSLKELMDATKGLSNMFLCHEVAVDKDFMLHDLIDDSNNLHCTIKKIVHDAFWVLMTEQLKETPPDYDSALSIVEHIRESLLMSLHESMKPDVRAKLDMQLIKQQADQHVLNVIEYTDFIVMVMAKSCAPVRDEEVVACKQLSESIDADEHSEIQKIVKLFRMIVETLENMKVDYANSVMQLARPLIVSESVEYEKTKFKEFLETQVDGLSSTREWLQRHEPNEDEKRRCTDDAKLRRQMVNRVLNDAMVELLEWDEYYLLPETFVMDQKRVLALRNLTDRVSVCVATILLTFSNVSSVVIPVHAQRLKEKMKEHTDLLLKDVIDDDDLKLVLPNVAEQVIADLKDYIASRDGDPLSPQVENTLREQIIELEDPNQRIRDLVQRRILAFCKEVISAKSGNGKGGSLNIPPGLSLCQKDLGRIAGNFMRLVTYNKSVFFDIYSDTIENHVLFTTASN